MTVPSSPQSTAVRLRRPFSSLIVGAAIAILLSSIALVLAYAIVLHQIDKSPAPGETDGEVRLAVRKYPERCRLPDLPGCDLYDCLNRPERCAQ